MSVSSQGAYTGITPTTQPDQEASSDKHDLIKVVQDKQQLDRPEVTGQQDQTSSGPETVTAPSSGIPEGAPKKRRSRHRRGKKRLPARPGGGEDEGEEDEGEPLTGIEGQWENLKEQVMDKAEDISDTIRPMGQQIKVKLDEYTEMAREKGQNLKEAAQQKFDAAIETAGDKLEKTKEYINTQAMNVGDAAYQVRETVSEKATDLKEEMGETLGEWQEGISETAANMKATTGEKVRNVADQAKQSLEQVQAAVVDKVEGVKEGYDNLVEGYINFKVDAASGRGPSLLDKTFTAVGDFSSWITGEQGEGEEDKGKELEPIGPLGQVQGEQPNIEIIDLEAEKQKEQEGDDSYVPEIKRD